MLKVVEDEKTVIAWTDTCIEGNGAKGRGKEIIVEKVNCIIGFLNIGRQAGG